MIYFILQCKKIYDEFVKDEITVYAAQASFFIVLSFFPFIMILLTVIQLVPTISQADLLLVISRLFPEKVYPLGIDCNRSVHHGSGCYPLCDYDRHHMVGLPGDDGHRTRPEPDYQLQQEEELCDQPPD